MNRPEIETYRPNPQDPYQAYRRIPPTRKTPRFTLDRVLRFLIGISVLIVTLWFLWYFGNLVIYLVIGVFLSYLMFPFVDRLQGFGLGRIPAILVSFVVVLGTVSILLTKLVPFAAQQISELSQQIAFEPAARIMTIEPGSGAELSSLQIGDAILAVDSVAWDGYSRMQALLRTKRSGDEIRILVENREGRRRTETVILGDLNIDRESQGVGLLAAERYHAFDMLGITVRDEVLSDVTSSIERSIRQVVPVETGAIFDGISTALGQLLQEDRITNLARSVVGLFADIFYAIIVIPFVAFFFLKDGHRIRRSILRIVPNRYFEITITIIEKIESIIGTYLQALLVQCISIATVASILLYIVGIKYAIAVGVFTGLANTIPYFGPIMGFLAGTLVGIAQSGDFTLVPGVLLAMGLTQLADNIFFQPFIFSRAAKSHPLLILFAVLIGAQLAGIVGMLLAIPVITIVRVTLEQIIWSLRNYRILISAS